MFLVKIKIAKKKSILILFLYFQASEVKVVYHAEIHISVNQYPKRFLKSPVVYFLRNTKGEDEYYYNKTRSSPF